MNQATKPTGVVERIVTAVSIALLFPTLVVFFVVVALTTVDVLLRLITNHPILGTIDVAKVMMVMMTWLAAAWIGLKGRHIVVDILVERLRPKTQLIIETVNSILGIAFCAMISWGATRYFIASLTHGAKLETLNKVPEYPVRFFVVAGAAVLGLVLALRFVQQVKRVVSGKADHEAPRQEPKYDS